jgi:hypothetical protein
MNAIDPNRKGHEGTDARTRRKCKQIHYIRDCGCVLVWVRAGACACVRARAYVRVCARASRQLPGRGPARIIEVARGLKKKKDDQVHIDAMDAIGAIDAIGEGLEEEKG